MACWNRCAPPHTGRAQSRRGEVKELLGTRRSSIMPSRIPPPSGDAVAGGAPGATIDLKMESENFKLKLVDFLERKSWSGSRVRSHHLFCQCRRRILADFSRQRALRVPRRCSRHFGRPAQRWPVRGRCSRLLRSPQENPARTFERHRATGNQQAGYRQYK